MLAPRYSPWRRIVGFGLGALFIEATFTAVMFVAAGTAAVLSGQDARVWWEVMSRYALWVTALSYPPLLGWVVYCRHFLDRRSVRSFGLRLDRATRSLGTGALGGFLAITWLFGAMYLCGALQFNGPSPEAFERAPSQIALSLAAYSLLFVAVAFMEELVFRGYLLHNLSASMKLRAAIWVQAIVFALIHLPNAATAAADPSVGQAAYFDAARALPSIAGIGAVFALMWAKSGTLWPAIGFHFAWNYALGCIFSLPVSGVSTFRLFDFQAVGNPWLSGGSFGAEGSILLWPILGASWWVLSRLPDHPQALRDLDLLNPAHPATLTEGQVAMLQAHQADQEAAKSAPELQPVFPETSEEEEVRESRFRTSMRPREAEAEAAPAFPILGQLPGATPTPEWTPPSPPSSSPFAEVREPAPQTEIVFSPLPAPLPTPEPQVSASAQADDARWQFQPLPGPVEATPQVLLSTPQVLPGIDVQPLVTPQVLEEAETPHAPPGQVLEGAPQIAPAASEASLSDLSSSEAVTEEAPEPPRPRRPAPRW